MIGLFDPDAKPPVNSEPPPAPEAAVPATLGQNVAAGWNAETVAQDTFEYTRRLRYDLGMRMFRMLPEESRRAVADRQFYDYDHPDIDWTQMVVEEAARQAKGDPTKWAGLPLDTKGADAYVLRQRQDEYRDAQGVLDRPGGGFGAFVGTAARDVVDPINLMMAPLGVEGGIVRSVLGEAAIGGVSNLANLPTEQRVAGELGLPQPSAGERFLEGALTAGGLTAALHGIVRFGVPAVARFGDYLAGRSRDVRASAPPGVTGQQHELDVETAAGRLTGQRTIGERLADEQQVASPGAFPPFSAFDFSAAGNASPKTNRIGYVYGKLLERGMTPEDAAAFVGNFMVESGPALHPGAVGDGGNALGIAQWNGERMRALEEHAAKAGKPADDLDTQLDFLMSELQGSEAPAWARIRAAGTVGEKAALVSQLFERPGLPRLDRRVAHAGDIYGQFQGGRIPKWMGVMPDAGDEVPRFATSRGYTGAGQVSTPSGRTIDVKYEVVDASILKRATGDLQPRDRSRDNSDAWIADTAARLDPAQLMPGPNAATGAPIVGPDNIIESGNGRFGAILHAYDRFPDRGDAYRRAIEDMTGAPIPPGVERPVLVARRTSQVTDAERAAMVVDMQDSGVARMTPTEIAGASSRAMTPELLGRLDLAAGLFDERNDGFIRAALATVPASERNALFADGVLNKAGRERIREAMFARAWPDPDMVMRRAETDGGELKSLLDALDEAAPDWAVLRADIEAGRVRPEADIGAYVLDALRLIAAARDLTRKEGLPMASAVAELLDEIDMLDGAVSPLTIALIKNKFWKGDRAASAAEIGDFLKRYAAEARKVASTETMFGASTAEILRRIDPAVFGDLPDNIGLPRPVVTRGQPPENAPPMAETAYAKGADSPEAEEADMAALEDLRGTGGKAPELTAADVLASLAPDQPRRVVDLATLPSEEGAQLAADLKRAQPFDDLAGVMQAAEPNHAALNDAAEAVATKLGLSFERAPLKEAARVLEKVSDKYAGNFRKIADVARAGVSVRTIADADAFVSELGQHFHLVDEGWIVTNEGYFDRKLMVRFDDGQLGEVQVWPPGMLEAKKAGGHDLYKISRDVLQSADKRADAVQKMRDLYGGVQAALDPSFAEKLGFAAPRDARSLAASASDSSTALSSPSTSSAILREPSAGSQVPASDKSIARPSSETAATSDTSNRNNFMGGDPSFKDSPNMGTPDGNVNSPGAQAAAPSQFSAAEQFDLRAARDQLGDLTLRLADGSEVRAADLLDDIQADEDLANVLSLCNPGGPA